MSDGFFSCYVAKDSLLKGVNRQLQKHLWLCLSDRYYQTDCDAMQITPYN